MSSRQAPFMIYSYPDTSSPFFTASLALPPLPLSLRRSYHVRGVVVDEVCWSLGKYSDSDAVQHSFLAAAEAFGSKGLTAGTVSLCYTQSAWGLHCGSRYFSMEYNEELPDAELERLVGEMLSAGKRPAGDDREGTGAKRLKTATDQA
ncbi:hypothetical protein FOZ62_028246 [Perkinsus olseni]|uniref:Uncharacterized protein n=1 Tax=Perkinsus olseni TaxID=32597 RepID=A0A7J6T0B6_PEROL|nr:hypothetical protein FOZ62_028246 [Perkinsus olseni]